jgi:hypothetical protein
MFRVFPAPLTVILLLVEVGAVILRGPMVRVLPVPAKVRALDVLVVTTPLPRLRLFKEVLLAVP